MMEVMYKKRIVKALKRIPGITEEIAIALYDAGYRDKKKIFAASDNDLKKVAGVSTAKLTGIKNYKTDVMAKTKPPKKK
jgi:hypothetical protein